MIKETTILYHNRLFSGSIASDLGLRNHRFKTSRVRPPVSGMLFSVLLLSLGAPFWFNILKSLASMRTSLVGKHLQRAERGEEETRRR
jgi:hypothetical protein